MVRKGEGNHKKSRNGLTGWPNTLFIANALPFMLVGVSWIFDKGYSPRIASGLEDGQILGEKQYMRE
jgi:hypothetical protein